MRKGDEQLVQMARQLGYPAARMAAVERAVASRPSCAATCCRCAADRAVRLDRGAGRAGGCWRAAAFALRWPALSRSPLRSWRLPDGALVLVWSGSCSWCFQLKAWGPTAGRCCSTRAGLLCPGDRGRRIAAARARRSLADIVLPCCSCSRSRCRWCSWCPPRRSAHDVLAGLPPLEPIPDRPSE